MTDSQSNGLNIASLLNDLPLIWIKLLVQLKKNITGQSKAQVYNKKTEQTSVIPS